MPSIALLRWSPVALALAVPLAAQSVKVSGSLALSPGALGGDVREARSTPDGSRILYLADQDEAGHVELYSVPADGSAAAVKLSHYADLGPSWDVETFRISADGTRVVFGPLLFSALVDGSAPAVQLASSEQLEGFEITGDSTRVVYLDPDVGLRVIPIDGGAATTLPTPAGFVLFHEFEIAPDSSRLVFRITICVGDCVVPTDLFSVPLDGSSAATQLNPPGSDVTALSPQAPFRIGPDSSRVVFAASPASAGNHELFSGPIDGSEPPVMLSTAVGPTGHVTFFEVDPTGARVVHGVVASATSATEEVYSAPILGTANAVRLNGPLVTGGSLEASVSGVAPFQITPDGARVVYRADQLTNNVFELFQVPIGGGTATRISRPLVALGDVRVFEVSPDSIGVLYSADGDTPNVIELYGAAYAGGSIKYNPPLAAGGDVGDFQITPDDARVVYRATGLGVEDFVLELFSVPILGGTSTKLNGPLVSGGEVEATSGGPPGWLITSDSTRVAYLADQDMDERFELFVAPVAGGAALQLNPELDVGPPAGDVRDFHVTPDSSSVVYRADGEQEDVFHLHRTSSTSQSVTQLSLASPAGTGLSDNPFETADPRLTADGTRMVYVQDADTDTRIEDELYSVRVDGSQPPLRLSQPVVPIGHFGFARVASFELSLDGSSIAYVGGYNSGVGHLFAVRADGTSAAPLQLDSTGQNLFPPGDREEFHVSPDGARLVYRSGIDLYSVRFDGSEPPVKLNGAFGPGGAIGAIQTFLPSFTISPDSSRVVYVADATVDGRVELFSVPIGGHRAPRRLNAALPPGGDVRAFAISPTGERVVYYADQEVDQRYELFSVPIDGARKTPRVLSAPHLDVLDRRVKLNGPLASGASVSEDFAIAPDGSRVVFVASPVDNAHDELFSAAIDGSQAPLQLTFGNTSTTGARFGPDGERVVYRASIPLCGALCWRLYSARVDGSQPPVPLSTGTVDTISGSGEVPFTISPDGNWVVYRADDVTPDVFALYARPIDGSQSPIELNSPHTGGDVEPRFVVTPDATRVLYRADHDSDDVFELYSTPLPSLP